MNKNEISQQKSHLRQKYKQVLKSLQINNQIQIISAQVCHLVQENWDLILEENENILFYWPFGSEIDIKPLIIQALQNNKKAYLPFSPFKDQIAYTQINLKHFDNSSMALKKGIWGNLEVFEKNYLTDFKILDLVFVPALAFDQSFNRLGRGLGFYDRLLANLHINCQVYGLIPNILFLPAHTIPKQDWDFAVPNIITEKQIIISNQN